MRIIPLFLFFTLNVFGQSQTVKDPAYQKFKKSIDESKYQSFLKECSSDISKLSHDSDAKNLFLGLIQVIANKECGNLTKIEAKEEFRSRGKSSNCPVKFNGEVTGISGGALQIIGSDGTNKALKFNLGHVEQYKVEEILLGGKEPIYPQLVESGICKPIVVESYFLVDPIYVDLGANCGICYAQAMVYDSVSCEGDASCTQGLTAPGDNGKCPQSIKAYAEDTLTSPEELLANKEAKFSRDPSTEQKDSLNKPFFSWALNKDVPDDFPVIPLVKLGFVAGRCSGKSACLGTSIKSHFDIGANIYGTAQTSFSHDSYAEKKTSEEIKVIACSNSDSCEDAYKCSANPIKIKVPDTLNYKESDKPKSTSGSQQ